MDSLDISLHNFQSISKADLTLSPGINVIVGPSNSGKTAIIRALGALISNPTRGKYFIKKGSTNTEVGINYAGNDIRWKRTSSDSSYEINGETYKKTGRNNLFDLLEDNGFICDESGNVMNIEGEWDLPFPFDRTPSELFKLFENIFCISDSALILKSFKDEEAGVVKDKVSHEDKLGRLNKKVEALLDLKNTVDLKVIEKALSKFTEDCEAYAELIKNIDKLHIAEVYASFDLDKVQPPKKESLTAYTEAMKDYNSLCNVVKLNKFYKSLPEVLVIGDTINKYETALADYNTLTNVVKLNKFYKSLPDMLVIGDTINKYEQAVKDFDYLSSVVEIQKVDLGKECSVTGETLTKYTDMLKDYNTVLAEYNKCKEKKAAYLELGKKIEEAEEALSKFRVCPLCGHKLGEE